jgi:hypothetical protein
MHVEILVEHQTLLINFIPSSVTYLIDTHMSFRWLNSIDNRGISIFLGKDCFLHELRDCIFVNLNTRTFEVWILTKK